MLKLEEIDIYVLKNYWNMSIEDMKNERGISKHTINKIARKWELPSKNKLTDQEIQFLKNNYPKNSAKRCAQILRRSYSIINNKLKEMGLKK